MIVLLQNNKLLFARKIAGFLGSQASIEPEGRLRLIKELDISANSAHFRSRHPAAANRMTFFDNCNGESLRS